MRHPSVGANKPDEALSGSRRNGAELDRMTGLGRRVVLGAAVAAAAVFFTTASGLPGGAAAAGPLASQAGLAADAGTVILAKDFKSGGGGGSGGDKGGKGGNDWRPGGGAIILGLAHCAIQSERCADIFGKHTGPYWRCLRRAGC
jgi:hypothetical protein